MAGGLIWREADLQTLRERYPTEGADVLEPVLCRPADCIRKKASQIGIRFTAKRKCTKHDWYTPLPEEIRERAELVRKGML